MAMIALLPGDGIGPEVIAEAVKAVKAAGLKFAFTTAPIGGQAIDETGEPLPASTVSACLSSQAVLLGAVGGGKWDGMPPGKRPEAGLLGLRKALGVYANIRPVRTLAPLLGSSTLKPEAITGVDLIVVRELTGGLYFGTPRGTSVLDGEITAVDTMKYTRSEVKRIAKAGFELARSRRKNLTSVDKANVLECSRLWREVVNETGRAYPDVTLSHMYVDNCAMQLIRNPRQFDVILTENMFGDILSDEAAMLAGSLGMLPSASLGSSGPGLYEPIHGSAPDIAGKGIANPIGAILSAAMMLRHSFKLEREARALEQAAESTLSRGYRTQDMIEPGASLVSTGEMGDLIAHEISHTL